MRAGVRWLINLWGMNRAPAVAMAYRQRFAGEEGRLVLGDLAHYCNALHSSFVAGDPHQTSFNEGARDAYMHVLEMASIAPHDIRPIAARGDDEAA